MKKTEEEILLSMSKDELAVYRFCVCQKCGKKMTRGKMEARRKKQQFPVCDSCLKVIIPLAQKLVKMQSEMKPI